MTKWHWGVLSLLVSVLCWGPASVFTKFAISEVPLFSLAFTRSLMAFSIVFILFFPKGYFKIQKKDYFLFLSAGLFGSVFNYGFIIFGLTMTSAIVSQAIFTATPVFTTILAYFFLKEKISFIQAMGVFIGLIGSILVAMKDVFETGGMQGGSLAGNVLVFFAMLSWVCYILLSKKLAKTYSPFTITSYSFLVALFAFFPPALWETIHDTTWISHVTIKGVIGILYQGIFSSVIAFLSYQTGLKLTSAFEAGVVLYLTPIITTFVAVPLLGETISAPFIFGTILIISGSVIATQYELVRYHVKTNVQIVLALIERH